MVGAGLDFAGVHDSFWTHAATVDTLNSVLRDNFVQLHSQPLLERLLLEFQALYPHLDFPDLPALVCPLQSQLFYNWLLMHMQWAQVIQG